MKNLKRLLITLGLITIVGVSYGNYAMSSDNQQIVYTTETVSKGSIENVVLTNGVLYPYQMVNVGAQVSGKLENIAVNVGDNIQQGDLIAQIDNLVQHNALKEAQASLNNINAQYQAKQAQIHQAQLAFKRQQSMLTKNVTSQENYDIAQAQLLVYKAELKQLVAQKEKALISVDNSKLDLGYTTINSPIDGTVIYVSVKEGQTVNTNQATPSIIEVAQLDTMTVKAQISEADIINVKPGQKVYFSILGDSHHRFNGVVRAIEPGPTLLTGDDSKLNIGDNDAIYYNALFEIQNPDHLLRIGMTAQVSIILASADDALLVPSQVLSQIKPTGKGRQEKNSTKGKGKTAYQVPVLVDNNVEMRRVKVGINNKVYAQITAGLKVGDQVVIGQANLANKSKSTSVKNSPGSQIPLGSQGKNRGMGPRS